MLDETGRLTSGARFHDPTRREFRAQRKSGQIEEGSLLKELGAKASFTPLPPGPHPQNSFLILSVALSIALQEPPSLASTLPSGFCPGLKELGERKVEGGKKGGGERQKDRRKAILIYYSHVFPRAVHYTSCGYLNSDLN